MAIFTHNEDFSYGDLPEPIKIINECQTLAQLLESIEKGQVPALEKVQPVTGQILKVMFDTKKQRANPFKLIAWVQCPPIQQH